MKTQVQDKDFDKLTRKEKRYIFNGIAVAGVTGLIAYVGAVVSGMEADKQAKAVQHAQAVCAMKQLGIGSDVEMQDTNKFFINQSYQGLSTIVGGTIVLRKGDKDTFNLAVGPYDRHDALGTTLVTKLQPCRDDRVQSYQAKPTNG